MRVSGEPLIAGCRRPNRQFNYATTWGETTWENVEPAQGAFNFPPLDQVVDFADQSGMPMKGIVLVWHEYLPAWVSSLPAPDLQDALDNHIATLVGRYAGTAAMYWDVVNEAIQNDATYRVTPFYQKLGPGYIAGSFHTARAADPDALLFYNDYGIEALGPKSDFAYQMIQDLLADGVPIDGVGFQMHVGTTSSVSGPGYFDSVRQNLQRFADLGLIVHLSESEVSTLQLPGSEKEKLLAQRQIYHDIVATCLQVAACHLNFFGFTDKYFWPIFFNEAPLVYDAAYHPKPAFFGVRDALAGY